MFKKKVFPKELIGLSIEVLWATNKTLEGMKGKIIDETKETFTIQTVKGLKVILKKQVKIKLVELGLVFEGRTLAKRPEERIKG